MRRIDWGKIAFLTNLLKPINIHGETTTKCDLKMGKIKLLFSQDSRKTRIIDAWKLSQMSKISASRNKKIKFLNQNSDQQKIIKI